MAFERLFDQVENIRLEKITKKYENRFVVNDINLKINGGELLIIIGPSGSGKTTMIRMINKMILPDSGEILINGHDVSALDTVNLRRNIGYVIQNIGLFPHMTLKENVSLVAKLTGWDKKKIEERVAYLLNFVSLPPEIFINRYPRQLSGGQQQRVGLARALMMDPPLLLMDEPFGALDLIIRKQLQAEFLRIKKEIGRTIIFITHDIEEAFTLGDRIAIMDNGKIIQIGTPEELIFNPKNELIIQIVNSNRKFKHLDTLTVKDVMMPIEDKYIIDSQMNAFDAIELMKKRNTEIVIIFNNKKPIGKLMLIDLLRHKDKKTLVENIARKISMFSLNEPIAFALSQMKSSNEYVSLVFEKDSAIGLLMLDEILLKLI